MEDLEGDSENDVEDSPQPYPVRASISITKVLILVSLLIAPINIDPDVRGIIV